MSEQQNQQLVESAYDAFGRGDIATVINAMADDVVWEIQGPKEIPPIGVRQGRAGVAEFFETLAQTQEPLVFEPQTFIAKDDRVVVLGHYSWKIKSTGRVAESDWAHVFTIEDGRVVRFQEFADTAALAAAYDLGEKAVTV